MLVAHRPERRCMGQRENEDQRERVCANDSKDTRLGLWREDKAREGQLACQEDAESMTARRSTECCSSEHGQQRPGGRG
jgi:hypothetical protein